MTTAQESCFNCNRGEHEIPIITWRYQGQPLTVCSQCLPHIIHKWPQMAAILEKKEWEWDQD